MGETQDKGPTFSLASAIKAAVGFAASHKPTKNALSAHHAVPAAADMPNDADATSSEADNESALRASQLTSPASDAVRLRAGVAYIRCVHRTFVHVWYLIPARCKQEMTASAGAATAKADMTAGPVVTATLTLVLLDTSRVCQSR